MSLKLLLMQPVKTFSFSPSILFFPPSPTAQCARRLRAPIFACWVLLAQLSVPLFLWMNDLANVLGLLAQSSALSVPATVVLILLSPAWPVATDVHANALPPVLAAPS